MCTGVQARKNDRDSFHHGTALAEQAFARWAGAPAHQSQ